MRNLLLAILLSLPIFAQIGPPGSSGFTPVVSDPTGNSCHANSVALRTPNGLFYTCQNGHYALGGNAPGTFTPSLNLTGTNSSGQIVVSPYVSGNSLNFYPLADSTTAFQVTKADKTTAVLTVDTTNSNATFANTLTANGNFITGGGNVVFTNVPQTRIYAVAQGTYQFGNGPDPNTPLTAPTIQSQSVNTGTSNTAGVNFTFAGSKGTGTGIGGALVFQTAPAGTTGSTQNALVESARVVSTGNWLIGGTTDGNYKLDIQKSGSSGTLRVYDQTASTGATTAVIQAGAADTTSTNSLTLNNNAGTLKGMWNAFDGHLQIGGSDTGLSRDSAGVIDFGTGAQGSVAGSLKATNGTFTGLLDVASGSLYVRTGAVAYLSSVVPYAAYTTFGASALTAAAPTVSAGQVGFGSTTAVVANCGAIATACIVINVAGTTRYIPYF